MAELPAPEPTAKPPATEPAPESAVPHTEHERSAWELVTERPTAEDTAELPPPDPAAAPAASAPMAESPEHIATPGPRARPLLAGWRERLRFKRAWVSYCLILILLLAASLRFVGLDWDQGTHLDPDERFLTMVETSMQWPTSVGQYLDEAHSSLNPRNVGYTLFVYGTLPTTFVKGVSLLLNQAGYDRVYLVGRALAGLCDLGAIVFLFLLARLLYRDNRIALLAAFLLSTSVLAIQYSHFFVTDAYANFFIMGALYFLARVQQWGRTRNYVLSGVFFGLALASKLSIVVFALVVVLVAAYRLWHVWDATRSYRAAWVNGKQTVVRLVLMGVATFCVFRVAQPDAFRGPGLFSILPSARWLANLDTVRQLVSGRVDFPPNHQWTDRLPLWFPWQNMVVWGMGLPLGLTAWTAWAVALWRLLRRRTWVHLIPVAWVTIVFLQEGVQWVKTMRYFLPIYPALTLLAAWVIVHLWDRARFHERRPGAIPLLMWTRWTAGLLGGVVTVGTLLWALAFVSIYTRPHSRVAASRWIYTHIPSGRALSSEGWDDALPLGVDGKGSSIYKNVLMSWYDEDTPQKLQQALGWLDQTDYIIESSNRLYGSIPRLWMRYPMTVRYYRALFDGSLGFKRVGEFSSYPQIMGIQFPDQSAEEAFTVYDHPLVQIFEKTPTYSRAHAARILGNVDWANIVRLTPVQVPLSLFGGQAAPKPLLLTPHERALNTTGPTYAQEFPAGSLPMQWPVLVWLFWVEALGLLTLPLTLRLFRRLPDRGAVLSKMVGLLLTGFLVWLTASLHLLSFNRPLILGAAVGVAMASLFWGVPLGETRRFVRRNRGALVIAELVFLIAFGADVVVRMLYPDLWHGWNGGEKALDFSYLNGLVRSQTMPPADPWFSGGYMNYYYYGFFLVATLIKLTGVAPALAYNLAVPTLFALTCAGAYTVGHALTRRVGPGLMAVAFAVLAGNLYTGVQLAAVVMTLSPLHVTMPLFGGVIDLIGGLWQLVSQQVILHHRVFPDLAFRGGAIINGVATGWGWDATRVLDGGNTINEFPFFTFLYADLHAHMIDLPIMLTVVALAANAALGARPWLGGEQVVRGTRHDDKDFGRPSLLPGAGLVMLLAAGVIVGATGPTNTWDLPTALLLVGLGVGVNVYMRGSRLDATRHLLLAVGALIVTTLVFGVLGQILYRPFYSHLKSFYSPIPGFILAHTALDRFLMMWGLFLFIVTSYIVNDLWHGSVWRWLQRQARAGEFVLFYWPRRAQVGRILLAMGRVQRARGRAQVIPAYSLVCALAGGVLALAALVLGAPVLALLLLLLGLTLAALLQPVDGTADAPVPRHARGFVLGLIAIALGITAFCEVGYLRDFEDGSAVYRMNTVFKLYEQAWYLFAIASAAALVALLRSPGVRLRSFPFPLVPFPGRPTPVLGIVTTGTMPTLRREHEQASVGVVAQANGWRTLWLTTLGLLSLAVAVYPILETPLRLADRANSNIWINVGNPALGPTLDGTAFVRVALPGEYKALTWLNSHVRGDPTVLAASSGGYTNFAFRVEWMTGLPDVVQWGGEQAQQRYNGQVNTTPPFTPYPREIDERAGGNGLPGDVPTIYSTTDKGLALRLLHKYDVKYVYVGGAEQGRSPFDPAGGYPALGLAKFDTLPALKIVYNKSGVKIYSVIS